MLQSPTISASKAEYVRVPSCVLKTLDRASVDLFLKHDSKKPPILFRSAGYPFTEDAATGNAQLCPESLYVRARDYADLSTELMQSLDETLSREDLAASDRYELLQCAVSLEVEQSLCMVSSDHYVNKTKTIGRQIVGLISENKIVPSDLFDIVRHDHHTFVHVTNVAGYVTLLAKELGITDRQELEKIAVGGLLHDLGKRQISKLILNKTSKLTDLEWEIIRRHPQTGYEELCQRENLEFGQLMMVYQHHEQLNGKGYPVGVTEEEIHPWAKMLAVVDVFDALTGIRPYRKSASCEETLQLLNGRAGTHFDQEIVACWTSTMQQKQSS